MAHYDAVLASLTPTEKVRRNVVLPSGLSFLLLHFQIETDGVTFLGARMPREVLYFAIFHALLFYLFALAFHGVLRGLDLIKTINVAAQQRAEILAGLGDTDPRVQHRAQELVEKARSERTRLNLSRDHQLAEIERVERSLGVPSAEYIRQQREQELRQARAFHADIEARLAQQTAIADGTANVAHIAKAELMGDAKNSGNPPGLAIFYVLVGEWVIPLIFGIVCAAQLVGTNLFTPIWQAARPAV